MCNYARWVHIAERLLEVATSGNDKALAILRAHFDWYVWLVRVAGTCGWHGRTM